MNCLSDCYSLVRPGMQAPLATRVRCSRGVPWTATTETGAPDIKTKTKMGHQTCVSQLPSWREWHGGAWAEGEVGMVHRHERRRANMAPTSSSISAENPNGPHSTSRHFKIGSRISFTHSLALSKPLLRWALG